MLPSLMDLSKRPLSRLQDILSEINHRLLHRRAVFCESILGESMGEQWALYEVPIPSRASPTLKTPPAVVL